MCQKCRATAESDPKFVIPGTKAELKRISCREPIDKFHRIKDEFIKEKHRQHKFTVKVCGPDLCMADRDPLRILSIDSHGVVFGRDYTNCLTMEYDNEAMSAGMGGGKASVGMEGFLYHHRDETGDITMNWHGFLSLIHI